MSKITRFNKALEVIHQSDKRINYTGITFLINLNHNTCHYRLMAPGIPSESEDVKEDSSALYGFISNSLGINFTKDCKAPINPETSQKFFKTAKMLQHRAYELNPVNAYLIVVEIPLFQLESYIRAFGKVFSN